MPRCRVCNKIAGTTIHPRCRQAVAPTSARVPATKPDDLPRGLRLRFRDDYTRESGIKDAVPGDLFFVPCYRGEDGSKPCPEWDGCPGQHLYAVCPDGRWWDIDGRAGNCTMRDDRAHRCWIRHGDPTTGVITVDKAGLTCKAGAGSIATGTYHGMLTSGMFNP